MFALKSLSDSIFLIQRLMVVIRVRPCSFIPMKAAIRGLTVKRHSPSAPAGPAHLLAVQPLGLRRHCGRSLRVAERNGSFSHFLFGSEDKQVSRRVGLLCTCRLCSVSPSLCKLYLTLLPPASVRTLVL